MMSLMNLSLKSTTNKGILFCFTAYATFSIQDAVMKWMVADFSVAELLFWRSLTSIFVCFALGGRRLIQHTLTSPVFWPLVYRSVFAALAWVFYYLSAKELSLAQMTTLYYSAPIIVVVLAVVLLQERPTRLQWSSVVIGFIGVVIASRPEGTHQVMSVLFALFSALLWAYTYILLRKLSGQSSIFVQMLLANLVTTLLTGASLPWTFTAFDPTSISMMVFIGIIGALGQYFLFASFEHAEASVLAPIEYTGLIWAFLFSYFIWGSQPNVFLIVGAALIALSGLLSVIANNRKTQLKN
ncbi:DMT family transporter [Marinomonas agarivorans]|nr:DMT family transporter [Marinomonas agarivorans]